MKVYIILSDTGTLFTRMIKMFTKEQLNHASISFTDNLDTTYSFGRKRPHNPFIGGFVQEDLKGKLFQNATCAIYSFSVSEEEYNNMIGFIKEIEETRENYKYNLIGLFGILFKTKIDNKNAFFCSQFVATVLMRGGFSINGKQACFVRPSDIINYETMKLEYAGPIQDYLSGEKEEMSKSKRSYINRKLQLAYNSLLSLL